MEIILPIMIFSECEEISDLIRLRNQSRDVGVNVRMSTQETRE
jgi:hypothetical protein